MLILVQLFVSFFQIGLFSIGGGYAALPLIQGQVVDMHGWLSISEFADLLTISQMTPGPIVINAATFVGTRLAGMGGAVVATAGSVLPSCIIVLLLAYIYNKYKNLTAIKGVLSGLRPAVVSLIASAGISILALAVFKSEEVTISTMTLSDINIISVILICVCVIALRKFKANPVYVMIASGVVGGILYSLI